MTSLYTSDNERWVDWDSLLKQDKLIDNSYPYHVDLEWRHFWSVVPNKFHPVSKMPLLVLYRPLLLPCPPTQPQSPTCRLLDRLVRLRTGAKSKFIPTESLQAESCKLWKIRSLITVAYQVKWTPFRILFGVLPTKSVKLANKNQSIDKLNQKH